MRFFIVSIMAVTLTACTATVPDSGKGVGFGDYDEYQREKRARDAVLQGNALPPPQVISSEPLGEGQLVASDDGADLAAQTRQALGGGQAAPASSVQTARSDVPTPTAVGAAGISQENNFDAVGAQRSIESDAERIAQNRSLYKVVEAEELPARSGDGGPNIVDYALATKHPTGTQVYRRIGGGQGKAQRNCGKYASPDRAQADFLAKGGPQRDRLGLDPDGDGYACSWDPSPFRKAVGG